MPLAQLGTVYFSPHHRVILVMVVFVVVAVVIVVVVFVSVAEINPSNAPMMKLLSKIPDDTKTKLIKLFRTAYYLALNNRPFSDFASLGQLQNLNDANLGNTYLSDKSCKQFISAIDKH